MITVIFQSNEAKRIKSKRKKLKKTYTKINKVSLQKRLDEYKDNFVCKNNKMYCKLCCEFVNYKHKNVINDHLNSKKHQSYINLNQNKIDNLL